MIYSVTFERMNQFGALWTPTDHLLLFYATNRKYRENGKSEARAVLDRQQGLMSGI
jgi:hypothetical protein